MTLKEIINNQIYVRVDIKKSPVIPDVEISLAPDVEISLATVETHPTCFDVSQWEEIKKTVDKMLTMVDKMWP